MCTTVIIKGMTLDAVLHIQNWGFFFALYCCILVENELMNMFYNLH